MEWCITHHIRAQYVETTLQCTEIKYSIYSDEVERVPEAFSGFTNPFSSKDNGVYFLSFGVPAKPAYIRMLLRLMTLARKLVQTLLTHF